MDNLKLTLTDEDGLVLIEVSTKSIVDEWKENGEVEWLEEEPFIEPTSNDLVEALKDELKLPYFQTYFAKEDS